MRRGSRRVLRIKRKKITAVRSDGSRQIGTGRPARRQSIARLAPRQRRISATPPQDIRKRNSGTWTNARLVRSGRPKKS
jgi:hypothetical protein